MKQTVEIIKILKIVFDIIMIEIYRLEILQDNVCHLF